MTSYKSKEVRGSTCMNSPLLAPNMSIILPGVHTMISAPLFSSAIWKPTTTTESTDQRSNITVDQAVHTYLTDFVTVFHIIKVIVPKLGVKTNYY